MKYKLATKGNKSKIKLKYLEIYNRNMSSSSKLLNLRGN